MTNKEKPKISIQELFVSVWGKRREIYVLCQFSGVSLYNAVRNTLPESDKGTKSRGKICRLQTVASLRIRNWTIMISVEEEIYLMAFQDDRRGYHRCKEIFYCILDGKKNEEIAAS